MGIVESIHLTAFHWVVDDLHRRISLELARMYLGIEIGGTKLQLGVGPDDGLWPACGAAPLMQPPVPKAFAGRSSTAVPELLPQAGIDREQLRGVGIGFGGPVDDATHTVIKSHQIEGWDNFPLADWIGEMLGLPAVLGNDADVAGLAEALHGAGKGLSPIFYITIGSGIGQLDECGDFGSKALAE